MTLVITVHKLLLKIDSCRPTSTLYSANPRNQQESNGQYSAVHILLNTPQVEMKEQTVIGIVSVPGNYVVLTRQKTNKSNKNGSIRRFNLKEQPDPI